MVRIETLSYRGVRAGTETLHGAAAISIAVSPLTAYQFISDVTRLPELSPECYRCEWENRTTAHVGGIFVGHNRAHGREWSTACHVLEADPGRRFAFATGTPEHRFTAWCYDFEPDGEGGTLVSESFEVLELPPHLAAADADARQARAGELEDGVRQTLVRLKQILEAQESGDERRASVVRAQEGTAFRFGDALMTIKSQASASGATVIEWISPPGGTAPLHVHYDLDDTFFVLDGELTLWCDGRVSRAGAGDYVVLPSGVPHSVLVEGERPVRALLIHANDQFASFVRTVGIPVPSETDPPPLGPDVLSAAARCHGQAILGPSPFGASTATPS